MLNFLRQQSDVQVLALVTTFNTATDRVAMHAVRRSLVQAQAERIGLPLWPVELPWPCSNAQYEKLMRPVWERAIDQGVTAVAFGDLFLEDIRAYREQQLRYSELKPIFPLWKLPTARLAHDMIGAGVKAKTTCVDSSKLSRSFTGCDFDAAFLERLPEGVDPCGENGEFHTFVYDSPILARPIPVRVGEIVERDGFLFTDVVSAE